MASPPTRRSGRHRKPNTRYANDLLEEDTRRILAAVDSEEEEHEQEAAAGGGEGGGGGGGGGEEGSAAADGDAARDDDARIGGDDDSDPDFDFDGDAAEDGGKWENGDGDGDASSMGMVSLHGGGSDSESNVVTPDEEDEGVSIAESLDLGGGDGRDGDGDGDGGRLSAKRKRRLPSTGGHRASRESQLRSRGLPTGQRKMSKESAWYTAFGVHDEDLVPILVARDTWLGPEDAVLPSRRTLATVVREGVYGPKVRNGIEEERLRREATRGWDWYVEERGRRFRKRQRVESVEDEEVRRKHFPVNGTRKHKIVLGPQKEQKMYELGEGEVMDLAEAWSEPLAEHESPGTNTQTQEDQSFMQRLGSLFTRKASGAQHNGRKSTRKRYREGWLFNLGHRAQSMSWAPNREDSQRHYLAIACPTTPEQRNTVPEPDDKQNPAFRPSGAYPSCIQLWEFTCSKTSGPRKLDMSVKPRVALVLCTDWGNIRDIKFCPILRERRLHDNDPMNNDAYLGLLGVLSSDGYVRVLDVTIPSTVANESSNPPEYLKIHSTCFASRPTDAHTVHASFSWASATDLIIGNADGSLGVYSILPSSSSSERPEPPQSTPYIHIPHHSSTYLTALAPALPSPRPTLLATASLSGYLTLLSLTSPHLTVSPQRQRLVSPALAYHPHLRAWFVFETATLEAFFARSFWSTVAVAKAGRGTLAGRGALAVSRWHPCVLCGSVGGEVIATNPLRKCLPGERGRGGGLQMVMWDCDWVRDGGAQRPSDSGGTDGEGGQEEGSTQQPKPSLSLPTQQPTSFAFTFAGDTNTSNNNHTTDNTIFSIPPPRSSSSPSVSSPSSSPHPLTRLSTTFPLTRPTFGHNKPNAHKNPNPNPTSTSAASMKSQTPKPKPKPTKSREDGGSGRGRGERTHPTETIYEEENEVTCVEWGACLANSAWVAVAWGSGWVVVEDAGFGEVGEEEDEDEEGVLRGWLEGGRDGR